MALTNDISHNKTNKLIDKSEKGIILKDTKDLPHNNILKVENMQDFIMPVKVEEFEKYFETAYQSGALIKEYLVSKSYTKFLSF
jgi:hypothetical protein